MRYAAFGLAGLIGLIILVGLIVELAVVPNQTVAEVQDGSVQMGEWQERVRYERAQIISQITQQLDLFIDEENPDPEDAEQNALRTIQQFAGQQLGALLSPASVGEQVLELMIQEELLRQGAADRGIAISEAEIDDEIGARYSFYDGGLPTPFPTPTETVMPTPSITPIPSATPEGQTEEESAAADPIEEPIAEEFPTSTPRPTNTPVSQASFDEQLQEDLDAIDELGANTDLYRNQFELNLLREKMGEALFDESGEATEVPHVTAFLLVYGTEAEAAAAMAQIEAGDFLTVWNTVRSTPPDPTQETPPVAVERVDLTAEEFAQTYINTLPDLIVDLEVGEMTDIVEDIDGSTQLPVYIIGQVSGKEVKELDQFTILRKQQEALDEWITEQREIDVVVFENWRNRVPRQPMIERKFVEPIPTPTPPAADGGLEGLDGFQIPAESDQ